MTAEGPSTFTEGMGCDRVKEEHANQAAQYPVGAEDAPEHAERLKVAGHAQTRSEQRRVPGYRHLLGCNLGVNGRCATFGAEASIGLDR